MGKDINKFRKNITHFFEIFRKVSILVISKKLTAMKHNLTFEDLEGALMLISFNTVDEDGIVELYQ